MNRLKLLKKLQDREFRRAYAEEAVDVGIPIQIREMRLARKWTQHQLGEVASVAQESVARAESLSYGRFTLATLKNLAAAFDCALIVRFAPFSELLAWKEKIDEATVTPPSFDADVALRQMILERPYQHSATARRWPLKVTRFLVTPPAGGLDAITTPLPPRTLLKETEYGNKAPARA